MSSMSALEERPDLALPRMVLDAVAEHTGEAVRVTAAEAGFTPGVKYLAETADGGFYFVKSVASDTWVAHDYEVEALAHRWLPATATRSLLVAHLTVGDHQTLVFRGLRDRNPGASVWADETEVADALRGLVRTYTGIDEAAPADLPSSVTSFWPDLTFWRDCASGVATAPDDTPATTAARFADLEGRAVEVLSGPEWATEVSHEDLRRDQFIIEADGTATVIDWSFVTRTPRIVDAVSLGIGVRLAGLDAEGVFNPAGPFARYDAHDINAVLAALAGYFFRAAREKDGKPERLCAAQLAQGRACTEWLGQRLRLRQAQASRLSRWGQGFIDAALGYEVENDPREPVAVNGTERHEPDSQS